MSGIIVLQMSLHKLSNNLAACMNTVLAVLVN